MNDEMVRKVAALAEKVGHVVVATADAAGQPHVAAARKVSVDGKGRLVASEWFCPGTVENLRENRRVAVVAWDAKTDEGLQAFGRVEAVEDREMMDGYSAKLEGKAPMPQVERELVVRVEKVVKFSLAPHTDKP